MSRKYTQQDLISQYDDALFIYYDSFAKQFLGYNGEYDGEQDAFIAWFAGEIVDYVNYNNIAVDEPEYIYKVFDKVGEDKEYQTKLYDYRAKSGWFKYELVKGDNITNSIKRELYNNKYRQLLTEEFNKFGRNHYITKDKNLFIENYDKILRNVPDTKDIETIVNIEIEKELVSDDGLHLVINSDNTSVYFEIKALIDILERYIKQGKITLNDRYTYSFFINDTWKTFTIQSFADWEKLITLLKEGSLIFNMESLEQLYWSDGFYNKADQVLPDLSIIQAIKLRKIPMLHMRGDNSGEFFRYTIKDQYIQLGTLLSNAQIFNTLNDGNKHRQELNYNCFCYALKIASQTESNLRVSKEQWEITFKEICKNCIGRNVSIKEVKDLVVKYNLYVNLTTVSAKDQKRNRACNKFGNINTAIITCNLGIFKQDSNFNHFFYNYKVPVSKYFTQHVDGILEYSNSHNQPIEWSYKVTRLVQNRYRCDVTKFKEIEMIDFIYNLFAANIFKPLTQNDTIDLHSDIHEYTPSKIESLTGHENNIKQIKYKEASASFGREPVINEEVEIRYFYADFEADPTSNIHVPYCCSVCERQQLDMKSFYGINCVEQLLEYLPDNSVTYFHNFGYDGRFIAKYGVKKAINKGSKIMNMKVSYNNKTLNFKDSYTMIAMPLKKFPSMFSIKDVQKELFPYNYYTISNVNKNIGTISQAGFKEVPCWNNDQYEEFNKNIDKINGCRIDHDHFNMEIYCKFYCEQDVRILALGHTQFRQLTLQQPIELDIDNYISAPALANAFFTKNVYSKIPQLKQYSGVYREFIQKGVYGGRCMTNSNKKYHVEDKLSDFAACSLYPSAMNRLYLPTGSPQECTEDMLKGSWLIDHVLKEDELEVNCNKPLSAFFVEIEITKVGKYLQFPLICKRTKQGNSNVNECCTMYVDNYVLEDLIKYQQIEYKVKRGYYWRGCKSPLLSKVIRQIYDLRVQYKREKNPLQEVLKLIMNSSYGKTIQKAINNDFVYKSSFKNKNGNSKADRYLSKNFHKIIEMFEVGNNITAFKTIKGIDDHYVPNFIGVQILSMSKRIMNEVMCTAEDLKIPIYYQDTDSMHIKVDLLDKLATEYKNRYNRELIGSDMGQFHSDFDHKDGGNEIISIESYFLGKKAYCDKLINENNSIDYHLRMKGIPNECLKKYAKDDFNNEPLELYKYLYEGNNINFNILDVKPSFEMKNDMTISFKTKVFKKD